MCECVSVCVPLEYIAKREGPLIGTLVAYAEYCRDYPGI